MTEWLIQPVMTLMIVFRASMLDEVEKLLHESGIIALYPHQQLSRGKGNWECGWVVLLSWRQFHHLCCAPTRSGRRAVGA